MADACKVLDSCTRYQLWLSPCPVELRAFFVNELTRPGPSWCQSVGGQREKLKAALLNLHVHTPPLGIWLKCGLRFSRSEDGVRWSSCKSDSSLATLLLPPGTL